MAMKKSLNNPNKPATKTRQVKGPVRTGGVKTTLTQKRGSNTVTYKDAGGGEGSVRNTNSKTGGVMRAATKMARKGTLMNSTQNPTAPGKTVNKTARTLKKKGLM
jgi:hypothetical protein